MVGYSDPNAYPSVEPQFLPYFGQKGEQWLLTYPAFQIALNKKLGENSARKAKALRILNAVMEDEAQAKLVSNSEVISYSKDSKLTLHESLSSIQPLIDKNRLFIRIASNDFFSVSKTVVQKMIKGEVTAQEAYAEFDAALRAEKTPFPIRF